MLRWEDVYADRVRGVCTQFCVGRTPGSRRAALRRPGHAGMTAVAGVEAVEPSDTASATRRGPRFRVLRRARGGRLLGRAGRRAARARAGAGRIGDIPVAAAGEGGAALRRTAIGELFATFSAIDRALRGAGAAPSTAAAVPDLPASLSARARAIGVVARTWREVWSLAGEAGGHAPT